jgi:serine/threonine protein phosphatase PrpC
MTCVSCGSPLAAGDAFCESCGAPTGVATVAAAAEPAGDSARTHLIAPPGGEPHEEPGPRACAACGGDVGADGYCTVCGVRASNGREHIVVRASATVVGVSDIGRVHTRNEDACALAAQDGLTLLVVCDGVTSTPNSDVAAEAAAIAARDPLMAGPKPTSSSPAVRVEHWSSQLKAAAVAANSAAAKSVLDQADNPPSCTFVAAIADADLIVAAWIGDSRAYWLPDGGPAEQLSVDDSWATSQIAIGVPREVAEADPKAHAITKWLGADSPDDTATVSTTTVGGPGWLLVCSDGLWNYCSSAADLSELIKGRQQNDPVELAESLVAWANEQGGHDNVTVTLARSTPDPTK